MFLWGVWQNIPFPRCYNEGGLIEPEELMPYINDGNIRKFPCNQPYARMHWPWWAYSERWLMLGASVIGGRTEKWDNRVGLLPHCPALCVLTYTCAKWVSRAIFLTHTALPLHLGQSQHKVQDSGELGPKWWLDFQKKSCVFKPLRTHTSYYFSGVLPQLQALQGNKCQLTMESCHLMQEFASEATHSCTR